MKKKAEQSMDIDTLDSIRANNFSEEAPVEETTAN